MKRPSFQFYPGDWTSNPNLRRCSHAEKGIWIDVMCIMHDQDDEYGVLRWPLKEIAQAVGCTVAALRGLVAKNVLKGSDTRLDEPFVYVPRSGRKEGAPVVLIAAQDGPIWYSSRMVKDEHVRNNAGASTRFGANRDGDAAGNRPPRQTDADTERAKLRAKVFAKTEGKCFHCSAQLDQASAWEIDHLIPRSKGGRHTFDNMVPSCVRCNQDKSDTMPDDWSSLRHSPSRRQGAQQDARQGERQGDGSSSSSPSSSSSSDSSLRSESLAARAGTQAGQACRLMREAGIPRVNPSDPRLLQLLSQGVTPQQLGDLATELREAGNAPETASYVLKAMEGRLKAAAAMPSHPPGTAQRAGKRPGSAFGDEIDRISAAIDGRTRPAQPDPVTIDVEARRVG